MFKFLSSKLRSFRRDEEGVTLVEYGIAIVLAVLVGTGALITLAGSVEQKMFDADTAMNNTVGKENPN